jgi:DNA polymerase I-like protein with 3'-5' exonuclease and polymerase domains
LLVHFAEITKCTGAKEAGEVYRNDPNADNHTMMTRLVYPGVSPKDESFKLARTQCKTIYLGLCYGMQGASLSRSLGLPTKIISGFSGRKIEVAGEEAQKIIDNFNSKVPYVSEMFEKAKEAAADDGYIFTLLRRRCRFPVDSAGNYDWTYKALNRLIQGSAADQAKEAMVQLDNAGFSIQLAVHDEIDLTVESRGHAEEVGEIMKNAIQVSVPMRVDVECGPNWGEIS